LTGCALGLTGRIGFWSGTGEKIAKRLSMSSKDALMIQEAQAHTVWSGVGISR
jgi:hypothetical protein